MPDKIIDLSKINTQDDFLAVVGRQFNRFGLNRDKRSGYENADGYDGTTRSVWIKIVIQIKSEHIKIHVEIVKKKWLVYLRNKINTSDGRKIKEVRPPSGSDDKRYYEINETQCSTKKKKKYTNYIKLIFFVVRRHRVV